MRLPSRHKFVYEVLEIESDSEKYFYKFDQVKSSNVATQFSLIERP